MSRRDSREGSVSALVFWMKGDGGIYVYGEGLGWAFTTAESLPYVFFFGQGGWKPIIFTPAKIP